MAVAPNERPRLAGPSRPLGSPEIPQFHLPATTKGTYAPRLYGAATIHFRDKKRRVDEKRPVAFLVPLEVNTRTVDWEGARAIDLRPDQLSKEAPVPGDYLPLPSGAISVKSFTRWAKNFDRWLARTQRLDVPVREDAPDAPPTIGPRRGGVSIELVAIAWEMT